MTELEAQLRKEIEQEDVGVEDRLPQAVPSPVPAPTARPRPKKKTEEPETTIGGVSGAVTRGLAKPLVQATYGAGLGLPFVPFTAGLSVPIGAAAAPLVSGISEAFGGPDVPTALSQLTTASVNKAFGTHYSLPEDATTELLDQLGVPKPRSAAERVIQEVTQTAAEMGVGAKGLGALAEVVSPVEKAVKIPLTSRQITVAPKKGLELLGEAPKTQAAIGGLMGGAGQIAEEKGATPLQRLGVELAVGVPSALGIGAVRGIKSKFFPSELQKMEKAEVRAKELLKASVLDKEASAKKVFEASEKGLEGQTLADITSEPMIQALENKLRKTSPELMRREIENQIRMTNKLTGALSESAVYPEQTQEYFKRSLDALTEQANAAAESLRAAGKTKAEEVLAPTIKYLQEQGVLVESGKITPEEAFTNATNALKDQFNTVASRQAGTVKDAASVGAVDAITEQRNRARTVIDALYDKAEAEGIPPILLQNTASAEDILVKGGRDFEGKKFDGVGEYRRLPQEIKLILQRIKKDGALVPQTFGQLRADLKAINAEIRAAESSVQRKADIPVLLQFKKALNADMETLGQVSKDIATANKFYAEYADIFKTGASQKAFKSGAPAEKALYEYIPAGVKAGDINEMQRLRRAIEGHPKVSLSPEEKLLADESKQKGLEKVNEWIYSLVADSLKQNKSSKSIQDWVTKQGERIFQVFPEARPKVQEYIEKFAALEDGVLKAKLAGQKATEIDKKYKEEADALLSEFQKSIDPRSNPISKFVKGDPYVIFGKVMGDEENIVSNMQALIQQASQDQTGNALEGLRNIARGWMNQAARTESKPIVTEGLTKEALSREKYKATLANIRSFMTENTPTRTAIEMLFGKNAPEIKTLDEVANRINMTENKIASGATPIPFSADPASRPADKLVEGAVVIGGGARAWLAVKAAQFFRDVERLYKGDIEDLMSQILVDAHLHPEVGATMLLEPTIENAARIQRLFATYGVNIPRAAFSEAEKPKEEKSPKK